AGGGRLFAGGDPLRAADGPPPVPRGDRARDARPGPRPGTGLTASASTWPGARPGDALPEVPSEAVARPLCDGREPGRRPAPLSRRPTDRRAAAGAGAPPGPLVS